MISFKSLGSLLFVGLLFTACGGGTSNGSNSFPKSEMLDNYGVLVGILADDFKEKSETLENSFTNYDENTSKIYWKAMASSWKTLQPILQTDKSQSTGENYSVSINNNGIDVIYPKVDSWLMGKNGDDKDFGIAKLEYIIFDTTNGYDDTTKATLGAKEAAKMVTAANSIKTHWSTQGSLDAIKSSEQESIAYIANRLREYMGRLIDGHIGLSAGLLVADQGTGIYPEKVESKLSGYSKEQAIALLEGIKLYYTGGDSLGIDDMLIDAGYSQNNNNVIIAFNNAIEKLNAIDGTLYDALSNDFTSVEEAFISIQNLDAVYYINVLTLMSVTSDMTFTNDGDTTF